MSSSQLFHVQEEEEDEKDTSRFKTTSLIIEEEAFPRSDGSDHEIAPAQKVEEEEDGCEKQERECNTTTTPAAGDEETSSVSSSTKSQQNRPRPSLGQEFEEVADDDDGFATPITSHHKIPVTAQCPLAPKKIRTPNGRHSSSSSTTKRKSPPRRSRRHLRLDLSREVELMFPPNVRDDLGRKIKKAKIEG